MPRAGLPIGTKDRIQLGTGKKVHRSSGLEDCVQAVKDIIKSRYSSLMWNSGLVSAWLKFRPRKHLVAILNYHHIASDVFADHVRSLVKAFRVISLAECCDYLQGRLDVPTNSVVITFDDAYRQFFDDVFPILKQYDVPATMFVPTDSIDSQEPLWFNRVKALVFGTRQESLRIDDAVVNIGEDRQRAYHEVTALLNGCSLEARDASLDHLFRDASFSDRHIARYRPLTWEQIREMREFVTFEAHTLSHPNLRILDSWELVREIEGSKRRLEETLNHEVRHFAFPFGQRAHFNDDVADVVRRGGFDCALTTIRGSCGPGDDLFRLPRIVCDGINNGRILVTRLSNLWVFLST
ncbi:MAG: polysaccharide deacetylase family protein [Phycisphaerales bacterium]|nr:polysaccharide deacetylase family protein [Phycisphaerales bacterium]